MLTPSIIQLYHYPFIFSNFNGTQGDVNVLTHEVGHAFQGYLSGKIQPPEYRMPTLESCEIHSMSMEFFAWPYMDLFFGKDADKYRYAHLSDAIEFLPYGISIDEFQHWVYKHPNATHEERCAIWLDIQSRYEPHKKYDDDTPYLTIDKYQGKRLIWEVILMKDKAKEFAEEIIKCIEK